MQDGEYVVVVHVVKFQYLFGSVVHLIVQDGEQQMLFFNFVGTLNAGFEHGQLQDVAGLLVEHQVTGVDGAAQLVFPDLLFKLGLDRLKVEIQTVEDVDDGAFVHSEQAQQQVFRAYRPAGQPCRFLT